MPKSAWMIDTIPAFCINMERRKDRWIDFSSQTGVQKLQKMKRFNAIDGGKLDIMNDDRLPLMTKYNIKYKTRRSHEELSTQGGVGCALSHIAVWEWMIENEVPVILVMEDDAKIENDFVGRMNRVIQKSPLLQDTAKWDILVMTGTRNGVKSIESEKTVCSMDAFIGLQCYVITLECARMFVKEAYTIHLHIDMWMMIYKRVHGLTLLCFSDYTVHQRSSRTDIQQAGGCSLCNVKSDYTKTHVFITKEEFWLFRAMEFALVATALYAVYKGLRGNLL